MAPTLEEVGYERARDALAEQRDVVASLRSRAAPLLAGALAALLAGPAVGAGVSFTATPAHAVLVCLGIVGAGIALLGAIVVLAIRDFDVDALYRAANPTASILRSTSCGSPNHTATRESPTVPACCSCSGGWSRV